MSRDIRISFDELAITASKYDEARMNLCFSPDQHRAPNQKASEKFDAAFNAALCSLSTEVDELLGDLNVIAEGLRKTSSLFSLVESDIASSALSALRD
ncbi:hypothetical protein NSA19_10905 [Actinomyces bowdenii]|uniref:Uncharacterized protein n=1 Tax=Actinomyces bowdenii TaxID=131109 RepID=A0A3P1UNS1_9ACTO|nr:hypothetical protein [Actinomyces bowdenii]MCR2053338.1 hypothetical protein [Actinomyces bowdenii]RRD23432.1 hypothetical protein EII10_11870 [Actinomyces bowdenii]